MIKERATKKAIQSRYDNIICVGYCDLQRLLAHERETAYTTRAEGWAADVYDFGNTAIVTGYAPFGNITPEYEINKKYNDKADKILRNYNMKYEIQIETLYNMIREYIEEVTQ